MSNHCDLIQKTSLRPDHYSRHGSRCCGPAKVLQPVAPTDDNASPNPEANQPSKRWWQLLLWLRGGRWILQDWDEAPERRSVRKVRICGQRWQDARGRVRSEQTARIRATRWVHDFFSIAPSPSPLMTLRKWLLSFSQLVFPPSNLPLLLLHSSHSQVLE